MKIVVIGGTGLIGKKLVNKLRESGHEVVAASPSKGINTVTGVGLSEALEGAAVVVDVTDSSSFENAAVLNFFETSTRNLLIRARPGKEIFTIEPGSVGPDSHKKEKGYLLPFWAPYF